jgi:Fe2+ transport system protein FeoA
MQTLNCQILINSAGDLKPGQRGRITGLGKGRSFRARMLGLGVRPGAELQIVGGRPGGMRLIQVDRQKFMLGAEMLNHIYIEGAES